MTAAASTRCPSATATIAARYGLRSATAAHFGLHDVLAGTAGTEYPVTTNGQVVGRRWKATPAYYEQRGRRLKYQTLSPAPHFPLYNLDAVRPGEPMVLAAGEPDVWVLHQAGIAACTFLFGEGTVPTKGVRRLVEARPSLITIVYDLDPPGRQGAERAYHALMAAGLDAEMATLPPDLGYGGDVADLYQLLHGNDAALRDALAWLPRHRPPPRPTPARRLGRPAVSGTGPNVFARIKATVDIVVVARRLTELHESRDGTRWTGHCPFHEDWDPSLTVWPSTVDEPGHFKCWGCGVGGDVIELVRLALERGLAL